MSHSVPLSTDDATEDDLLAVLHQLRGCLTSEADQRACAEIAKRWQERTFHLAVLGQFKRGKSTLVNALIGRPILPSAVLPLTAVPTFVRHATPERLIVHFSDGRAEETDISALARYVTEKENPNNHRGVQRVEVFVDADFPPPGISLIDTPGIGSVLRHNTAATVNILSYCDAALFVISPDPPLTEVEETFLRTVAGIVPRVIPVMTKADVLPRDELAQLVDYNRRLLIQILEAEDLHLYTVAAARVLEKQHHERDDGFEFLQLKQALLSFLQNEREAMLRHSLARRALAMATQQRDLARVELKALRMDEQTRQEGLQRFLEEAKRLRREQEMAIDVLNADGARLIMTVNRAAPQIAERVRSEAFAMLTKLVSEVTDPREIREGLPSVKSSMGRFIEWAFTRERAQLERTVRERVTEIVREHTNRCAELVRKLVQFAGDLFAFEVASPATSNEFTFRVEDYWPVLPAPVMLGTIPLGVLAPFLPKTWVRRYHSRRIFAAVEEAVRTNTERLRFALAQAVESSLVAIREELLRQYDSLVQRVQKSVEAAREIELSGREARLAREQALQSQICLLEEIAHKLEKWTNNETRR